MSIGENDRRLEASCRSRTARLYWAVLNLADRLGLDRNGAGQLGRSYPDRWSPPGTSRR